MATDVLLPELVRDTELTTKFRNNNTVTIHQKRWNPKKREFWHRNQRPIGIGGYGRVWLEQEIDSRGNAKECRLRAVKEISCSSTQRALKEYVRELEAIAKFSQEKYADYFVRSLGWYQCPNSLYIAMEYCAHGDLKNHLADNGAVGEPDAQVIVSQILRGLAHMHEERFAHRDLKPANILIVSKPPDDWVVKLSDFGLSKRAIESESTTVKGTFAYLPPELLDEDARRTDHFAGDMWCVGETAFELLTAVTVFPKLSTRLKYVSDNTVFPSTEFSKTGAGQGALDFVMSAMAPCPSDRPSAFQALTHAWFPQQDDPEESPQIPHIAVDWPETPSFGEDIPGTDEWTTAMIPAVAGSSSPARRASVSSALSAKSLLIPDKDQSFGSNASSYVFRSSSHTTLPLSPSAELNSLETSSLTKSFEESKAQKGTVSPPQQPVTERPIASSKKGKGKALQDQRSVSLQNKNPEKEAHGFPPLDTQIRTPSASPRLPAEDSHKASTSQERRGKTNRTRKRDGGWYIYSGYDVEGDETAPETTATKLVHDNATQASTDSSERKDRTVRLSDIQAVATQKSPASHTTSRSGRQDTQEISRRSPQLSDYTDASVTRARFVASEIALSVKPKHIAADDWLSMVVKAEDHCALYLGPGVLPELQEVEAGLQYPEKELGELARVFLLLLEDQSFDRLLSEEPGAEIYHDACLLLLLSMTERNRVSAAPVPADGQEEVLPYLPTYEAIYAHRTVKCGVEDCTDHFASFAYYCKSCDQDFCVHHRNELDHGCAKRGAFERRRRREKPLHFKPPAAAADGWPRGLNASSDSLDVHVPNEWEPKGSINIVLVPWDDQTALRARPHFPAIGRAVDSAGGKLYLGRSAHSPDTSATSPLVGFKSKVISRKHAEIELRDNNWWLRDVGSASGTFLNGNRLSAPGLSSPRWRLNDGDVVQLGTDFTEKTEDAMYGAVQVMVNLDCHSNKASPESDGGGLRTASTESSTRARAGKSEPRRPDFDAEERPRHISEFHPGSYDRKKASRRLKDWGRGLFG